MQRAPDFSYTVFGLHNKCIFHHKFKLVNIFDIFFVSNLYSSTYISIILLLSLLYLYWYIVWYNHSYFKIFYIKRILITTVRKINVLMQRLKTSFEAIISIPPCSNTKPVVCFAILAIILMIRGIFGGVGDKVLVWEFSRTY